MNKALIVIDLQKDYFEGGKFPLWNTKEVLANIEEAILKARENDIRVILIQHVSGGDALFFNEGSEGADIHGRILKAAPDSIIVRKEFADAFHKTNLDEVLLDQGISEIMICGMMTQNCVTHTAISKSAEKYRVKVLSDCCTATSQVIHKIAVKAISTRVEISNSKELSWKCR